MHEHHEDEIERRAWQLAERFVVAVEKIALALLHPLHPAPGIDHNTQIILEAIAKTGEKLMSQGQDLLDAVGRVQDKISPIGDKVTEIAGEVQTVIGLLSGANPEVTAAIAKLNTMSDALGTVGTNLQAVDDALDSTIGGQGGGGGPAAPTITSFSPNAGAVGSSVSLTGTGLGAGTTISLGGSAPAPVESPADDGSSCSFTIPTDATTGVFTATNAQGSGASTDEFTVQ